MLIATLSLIVLEGLTLVLWQRDRIRLLNAVMARSPQEFQKLQGKLKKVQMEEIELANPVEVEFGL